MSKVVGGKYQPIVHLGGGVASEVSVARVDGGEDLVVVKRLTLGADADPDVAARFGDEARLSTRVAHANVVEAKDSGEDDDGPFLVLEYLDGQTLARIRARAARRGGLPAAIAVRVVIAVTSALAYLHEATDDDGSALKIIHRDVSPENVLVTYDGRVKLIDFSAAASKIASVQGRAGATRGNIAYMAPEQGKAAVNVDARADVFAAGVVLWELLAGKRLWEGRSEADILSALADVENPLPKVKSVAPGVADALEAICAQALAKVRDDRFESAAEMRDALAKAAKTLGLEATDDDVATFVRALFEEEREKARATIAEALAGASGGAGAAASDSDSESGSERGMPSLAPPAQPSSSSQLAAVAVGSEPALPAAAVSEPALPAQAAVATAVATPPPAPVPVRVEVIEVAKPAADRRFAVAIAGAAIVTLGLVAVIAVTQSRQPPPPKDEGVPFVPMRPMPSDSAATAPSASTTAAEGTDEEVTIEISVTPKTATLTIDGVPASGGYFRKRLVRGKFVHEIHAEETGFEPQTLKLAFDRDRDVEIALVKSTKPPSPAAPAHSAPHE